MRFLLALLLALVPCAASAATTAPKPARYGMNLPPVNYWTPNQLAIDQMKLSPGWSQQGAPANTSIAVDADGLPTAFPAGASMLYTMILLEDGQTYEVTYTAPAQASIAINGCAVTSAVQGKIVCKFSGSTLTGTALIIKPEGAFPTNIHVVRQDRAAAFAAGEKFAPDEIEKLKGFSPLRAMDWTLTNGSQRTDMIIADTKGSYAPGVPIAAIVDLANKTGARPWINMPALITDDAAKAVFTYVKANLKAGIAPIYEYSNEMWNDGFSQTNWAKTNTVKPGDNLYWLGYRTGQLAKIGRPYGARFVLMSQFGVAFRFPLIYAGFKDSGAADSEVEAAGAADYLYGTLTDWQNPDGPNFMAANDITGALANVRAQVTQFNQYHVELAAQVKAHGWKYWTYEGANFHLNTLWFGDKRDSLAAFYAKVQMDPRAADIISAGTDNFQAAGGEIETPYNWSSPSGTAGFFGLVGTPTFDMMKARMAAASGSTVPTGGTSTPSTNPSTTPSTPPTKTPSTKPSAQSKKLDALAKRAQQLAADIAAIAAEKP